MQPGLVSTIIPVYNRPQLLREAVRSVLAQTYRPIEILVVDDGSTDDTPAVARELSTSHPDILLLLEQENAGPGVARERGRQAARGEFVQYLDSDDLLAPTKFELQVEALRAHPECGAAYGKTRAYGFDEEPRDVPLKRTGEVIETMFPAFLRSRWWSTSTPLFRRAVTDAAGPWQPLRNEEDWEHDCRVAALGTRLCYVDAFVSDTRYHAGARLSRHGSSDPDKLRDRARAHALIYGHAAKAGIQPSAPEMRHFARELFLLARQCGAASLPRESEKLFHLARRASEPQRAARADFRLYLLLARLVGWSAMGRFSCFADRFRSARS